MWCTSFLLDGSGDLRVPHVHILHMIGLSSLVCEGFYAWLYMYLYVLYICMGFAKALCFEHVYTCGVCFEYVLLMFHYCECTVVMSLRLWI